MSSMEDNKILNILRNRKFNDKLTKEEEEKILKLIKREG